LDSRPYLPWTDGALRPAALVRVLNEIVFADRRDVVELGSGASTVVLARLLNERGGRLTSVEHSPEWAAIVRTQLESEGLTEVARLVEAPLAEHPLGWDGAEWYSAPALDELPRSGIDLLLVDGPPGYGEGTARSRFPALPVLAERLAPGALVILDDLQRQGEREIVERWGREMPEWEFGVDADTGIAIGHLPDLGPKQGGRSEGRIEEDG